MRGDRLKARRQYLRLTQEALEELSGLDQKSISEWETGKRGINDENLIILAGILDTSSDWLLGITDDPTRRPFELSPKEQAVINAWRVGNREEAARVILIDGVQVAIR